VPRLARVIINTCASRNPGNFLLVSFSYLCMCVCVMCVCVMCVCVCVMCVCVMCVCVCVSFSYLILNCFHCPADADAAEAEPFSVVPRTSQRLRSPADWRTRKALLICACDSCLMKATKSASSTRSSLFISNSLSALRASSSVRNTSTYVMCVFVCLCVICVMCYVLCVMCYVCMCVCMCVCVMCVYVCMCVCVWVAWVASGKRGSMGG
jgi:hypothetical protein